MGTIELVSQHQLLICSHIVTYGNVAGPALTEYIRDEIETLWNEPMGLANIEGDQHRVTFKITASFQPQITATDIYENVNPRNNYFRIEEFVHGNISFVDSINCNSGYFKLENLYKGSTTAAHEYGHTLGLDHPQILDIRGKGIPSIMYPRGTLVDAMFQYDPSKPAGIPGGTMHPMHRKVTHEDIDDLKIHKLQFHHGKAIIGEFTNIWHPDHATVSAEDFMRPPIFG